MKRKKSPFRWLKVKCSRCWERFAEKNSHYCQECNDDQAVREGFKRW